MKPSELLDRIDQRQALIEQKLEAILVQTTKTNGRVNAIEDRTQDLETFQGVIINDVGLLNAWRNKLSGIWFTIFTICGAVGVVSMIVIGVLTLIK